jgi:hypothetical protein
MLRRFGTKGFARSSLTRCPNPIGRDARIL